MPILTRKRMMAVATLAALLFLVGCSSDEEVAQEHLRRAEAFLEENDLAAALIELKNALARHPQDAEINFRIAEVVRQQGKLGEAIYYYQETRRLDPSRVDTLLEEARLIRRVDPQQAASLVDQALEAQPGNVEAHVLDALLALGRQDVEAGLAAAQEAVSLAPEEPDPLFALGRAHLVAARQAVSEQRQRREEPDPPRETLEAALAAFDASAERAEPARRWQTLEQRGAVLAAWPERRGEADGAYREAVAAAEAVGEPSAVVGAAGAALRHARAVEDRDLRVWALEKIVAAAPELIARWIELAFVQEEDAETVYRQLLAARPDDTAAHLAFARFLLQEQRSGDAVVYLEEAAAQLPEPAELLGPLVALLYELGRNDAAAAVVNRLEAEFPAHLQTELARAERAMAERQHAEAARILREVTGSRETAAGEHLLAQAELMQGDLPTATATIERAIALEPRNARHRALRARIRYASRNWEATRADLRWIARRARRLDARERVMLAVCRYETGYPERGRAALEPLVTGESLVFPAVLEYARREGRERPAEVRALLQRAHAEWPDAPEPLVLLAGLDLADGQADRARQRLDRALESGSPSPDLWLTRAQLLAREGRLEEAAENARKALELAPQRADVVSLYVGLFDSVGRSDEAVASLDRAAAAEQLGPGGLVILGRLHYSRGAFDRARELLERGLALRPDMPLAKNDLAYLMAEQEGDLVRARALAEEAYDTLPEHPEVLHTLGTIYLRMGLDELAATRLQEAVDRDGALGTPDATRQFHLGLALRKLRRNRSAAEAFEAALRIDPEFPEAERARREWAAARSGEPPPEDLL